MNRPKSTISVCVFGILTVLVKCVLEATERTQYACAEGGTLTLETGRTRIRESDYSHDTSYNIWEFDSCQTELDAGVPVAGSYEIIGKLAVQKDFVSGTRFYTHEK